MKKGLVVITGASAGIGEATAIQFSNAGYPLLLIARRLTKLKSLNLPNTLYEEVDVTELSKFKAAIEKAEEKFGETECLINNAGILFINLAHQQNPEEWKKMLDVNVLGVLYGIHLVLQNMIKKQKGTIINISSLAGRKTFPTHAIYCATKFAVHSLTESIREEVADHNVRLITIAPGNVKTEILDQAASKEVKDTHPSYKRKPYENLQPEDVARAILFAHEQPQNVCIREIVICPTRQMM
jgi:NADP-dependent 3-hydroxy acid dehydrogenase YdfG